MSAPAQDGAEVEAALREALRQHEPLPGLPLFCACGHQAETKYQRETHMVEILNGATTR